MTILAPAPEPGTIEHLHSQVDALARHVVSHLGAGADDAYTEVMESLMAAGMSYLGSQYMWSCALRRAEEAHQALVDATTPPAPPTGTV